MISLSFIDDCCKELLFKIKIRMVTLSSAARFISILLQYSVYISVSSGMQVKTYLNDNEIQNQELLTLDTISPIWAKRLEESNYFPYYSLDEYNCTLNLEILQGAWLEKHMVFLHLMYMIVNDALKLVGSLCFL